jgi:hypothetical protein
MVAFGVSAPAAADTVDVSYTVSGSPGAWVYDFSVTNNIGGTNRIFMFGIQLGKTDIVGSPAPFAQGFVTWTT